MSWLLVLSEQDLLSWQSYLLISVFLLVSRAYYVYQVRDKINVPAAGVPPIPLLGSWIAAWRFTTNSATIIEDGFRKYAPEGKSFKISTPGRWVVVATHQAVLNQLRDADEAFLPMQAAANERNSMSYAIGSCIHQHPYQIAIINKNLAQRLSRVLPEIVEEADRVLGETSTPGSDWAGIDSQKLIMQCITTVTNRVLVGRELSRDQEFLDSALELIDNISRVGLVIDLTPRFLKYIFACYLIPKRGAYQVYLSKLGPVFEERRRAMQEKENGGFKSDKPNDAIQWVLEATPPETSLYDLCAYILYLEFSSFPSAVLSLTNAMYDLATHRHFQDPIKDEIENALEEYGGWTKYALTKMKMLDSSLRESQRLNPVTTATMMRRAQHPQTLADGTYLPQGKWIVCPAWALNRSKKTFTNPDDFDAFRFSEMRKRAGEEARHQYSTPEEGFTSFGVGRHACPGRFFAALELKVVLAHIIRKFEFKLAVDHGGVRLKNSFFTFSSMPDYEQEVLFRAR